MKGVGVTTSQADHYQVLMVDREVDADLLTTVYRRLVQRYQASAAGGGAAVDRLAELERAYAVLREPYRRARYDAELAARETRDDDTQPTSAPAPRATPTPMPVVRMPAATTRLTPVAMRVDKPSGNRTVPVSVLDFGRYAGWSLRQLAAHDPDYLEWLLRSPGGRQYRAEITALLEPSPTASGRSGR